MAPPTQSQVPPPHGFAASSDTALCLIPPQHLWERLDRLRSLYDKGYKKWPPHINLVYPFVELRSLEEALEVIQSRLDVDGLATDTIKTSLTEANVFTHKNSNTLFLRPSRGSKPDNQITRLANSVHEAIGRPSSGEFNPHMTIAQSEDASSDSHKFLLEKLRLLAPIEWESTQLAILVRNKTNNLESHEGPSEMRLWGFLNFGQPTPQRLNETRRLYHSTDDEQNITSASPQTTYNFSETTQKWTQYESEKDEQNISSTQIDRLIVASYNVLADFEWPPSSKRHPGLIETILSRRATADILVLQEVTDSFLVPLLADPEVRARYPYSSQGPPDQSGIGPLPSLLNIVILSKFSFDWSHLRSNRKHKGAAVANFPSLKECSTNQGRSLALAACHLSQGLVDGAVNAKKAEVQGLLKHLSTNFENHPWIIAGDFNLSTSVYTLDMARQRQDLSSKSYNYLRTFNPMLAEQGIQDAWLISKILSGESSDSTGKPRSLNDVQEGEQGATFDPLTNTLASNMVGSGLNNRPQRYDRIFVNDSLRLRPRRFNLFGNGSKDEDTDSTSEFFSDHWGIRCLLEAPSTLNEDAQNMAGAAVRICHGSSAIGGFEEVKKQLGLRGVLPSNGDSSRRSKAIQLLETVLQCEEIAQILKDPRKGPRMLLVPVGSFAMGNWTASSDVDCLCIGEISSQTFFSLATQRLRKSASEGIVILRRVKATSGTMLELDIQGIRFDLQYCSAPSILDDFPHILRRPSTDAAFALPPSVLSKLKPLRDFSYLQRSIPDLAQYTIVHLFLSTWARHRGIYGAKFGLLGSVHISVLLVPICKSLALEFGSVSVGDVISTFFRHYSTFDWKNHAVFDPFFHESLKYHRTFREPLCLLGWHAPSLNTAANASVPTATTLADEIRRANKIIGNNSIAMDSILGPTDGDDMDHQPLSPAMTDFLHRYKSYVKISVHYWGSSSTAGAKFVGWLESRCVMLLVDLDRKVSPIAARIWPQRFTEEPNDEESEAGPSCHGCYLIGLTWQKDSTEQRSNGDARLAEGSLQSVLRQFESRMRGDQRYFDPDTCWMSADVVRQSEVSSLSPDHYHPGDSLGEHGMSEDEDMSDDEDEDEDEVDETNVPNQLRSSEGEDAPRNVSVPGKFRTARDVMNRIRWDAALDSSDYIIGYEDRFVGACEKQLELWKSEQTDEEFIPQHRILYFKRRSDDVIVWERRLRVDNVFGSGVPARTE